MRLLTKQDVLFALGYTPYDAANPISFASKSYVDANRGAPTTAPVFSGLATFNGQITALGLLDLQSGQLKLSSTTPKLTLGQLGTQSMPTIDFLSLSNALRTYDARINVTGGSATQDGQGVINFVCSALTINGASIATTGTGAPGTKLPLMDSSVPYVGSSVAFSREDHVHPTDTSRLGASGASTITDPSDSGTPTLTIAASASPAGSQIKMVGDGSSAPSKTLRVSAGIFGVVNDGYTATLFTAEEGGRFTIGYNGLTQAQLVISGAANSARQIKLQSNGLDRWRLSTTTVAEAGGNVGSDLILTACDDTGLSINTPLTVKRSTGVVQLGAGARIDSKLTLTGNVGGAAFPGGFGLLQTVYSGGFNVSVLDSFGGGTVVQLRSAGNTSASPAPSPANAFIGEYGAMGYGATGFPAQNRAMLAFSTAENWSDTAQGAYAIIRTTPVGTLTPLERVRVMASGRVTIRQDGQPLGDDGISTLQVAGGIVADSLYLNGTAATQLTVSNPSANSNGQVNFSAPNSASGINITLGGNGATTPNKTLRAYNGAFEIVNSAYSAAIFRMDDVGNLTLPNGNINAVSIAAKVTGNGSALLQVGDPTHTGYLALFNAAGVRQGYIGFATNQINMNAEGSATGFNMAGSLTVSGSVACFSSGTFTNSLTINDTNTDGGNLNALQIISPNNPSGANIKLTGVGATTPSKYIRAINGTLQVINSAYSAAILGLTDGGDLNVTGGFTAGGAAVVGGTVTANRLSTAGFTVDVNGNMSASGNGLFGSLNVSTEPSAPVSVATKNYVDIHLGRRNLLHNALFRVNQRGAGFSGSAFSLPADRWYVTGQNGTNRSYGRYAMADADRAGIGDEDALIGFSYSVTGSSGSNDYENLNQRIESVATLAGKTATLSFWAVIPVGLVVGLELFQYCGTGGSPAPSGFLFGIGAQLFVGTGVWKRYTSTPINVPSLQGKTVGTNSDDFLGVSLYVSAGSAYQSRIPGIPVQTGYFRFWGMQLEQGPSATPLEKLQRGPELLECQRFFNYVVLSIRSYASVANGTTEIQVSWPPMRVTPGATAAGAASQVNNAAQAGLIPTSNSGGRFYSVAAAGNADTYVLSSPYQLSAELV